MLSEVCAELKNYFTNECDRHVGDWAIKDGAITPSIDLPTNYIRIVGSRLNDGVHEISKMSLKDEEFHGAIWIMCPPEDFIELVTEIEEWQKSNCSVDSLNMSPFQSESFGGYSYSKGTGSGNSERSSAPTTWEGQYASRLKPYRRIRV